MGPNDHFLFRRIPDFLYIECAFRFKKHEVLIEALVATGFVRNYFETHGEAVPLFGYRGDQGRNGSTSSSAASTLAWPLTTLAENDYRAARTGPNIPIGQFSEYDSQHCFNPHTLDRMKQEQAYHTVARQS